MRLRVFAGLAAGLAIASALLAEEGASTNVRINLDDQPQTAPTTAPGKATTSKTSGSVSTSSSTATSKAAPVKKGSKTDLKKKEPEPKIDGFAVSRGDLGFLGIKIVDNQFRIAFYGKDKKPKTADVAQIALRWPVQYQPNPERTLLVPADDGKVMASEKTVRPPFHFRLYITLLKGPASGGDPVAEDYVVEFAQ